MFLVGDTEFGIDNTKTVARLSGEAGSRYLVINLFGDRATFNPIEADDDSAWGGTLYPPEFQLSGPRCEDLAGYHTDLPGDHDPDHLELAFYMLSHCPAEGRLSIEEGRITVTGRVLWRGDWLPLRIEANC